jgi:hypothetical protein
MPDDISAAVILVVKAALAPLQAENAALKARVAILEGVCKDITAIRERLAVAEVRQLVPGPAGKDGKDGFGFDDLSVSYDKDRTIVLAFQQAGRTKQFPLQLPFLHYQGVYIDGKLYAPGDVVTHAGSAWHCNAVSGIKPGDGSADWTLMVKRGQQGAAGLSGRDAYNAPPVDAVSKVKVS